MAGREQKGDGFVESHSKLSLVDTRWAQHQAQHSPLGPALSAIVYSFNIRPFMLSPARAQQPHIRAAKSPAWARRPARRCARGLELDIFSQPPPPPFREM